MDEGIKDKTENRPLSYTGILAGDIDPFCDSCKQEIKELIDAYIEKNE